MTSFRILSAVPRAWPWSDDGSLRTIHWAESLQGAGHQVTLITPRWDASWPATAVCRETPMVRLLPAPRSSWNQVHFLRALGKWIGLHRHEFDLFYVDEPLGMLHAMTQFRGASRLPLIGRFDLGALQTMHESMGAEGWKQAAEACRKLSRVIVPDAASHRFLKAAGILDRAIHRIPDLPWYTFRRDAASKRVAKNALLKISSDLDTPNSTRMIMVAAPIERSAGLMEVCRAIGSLLDRGRDVRAWIIGTGSYQRPLYDYLREMAWHRDILLQGSFDSVEEWMQVADLCIYPPRVGEQFYVPMSIASNTPILLGDSPERRARYGDREELLVPFRRDEISQRLESWLDQPDLLLKAFAALRHVYLEQASVEQTLAEWTSAMLQASVM